jgi:hypothetical protein
MKNEIKLRAKNSFDSPRIIKNSILSGKRIQEIVLTDSYSTLGALVSRSRAAHYPRLPDMIENIEIPEYLKDTIRGKKILFMIQV